MHKIRVAELKIRIATFQFRTFNLYVAYIGHFIFAGCYDNDPWYLAGHLDLEGYYFSKCPANDRDQDFFDL